MLKTLRLIVIQVFRLFRKVIQDTLQNNTKFSSKKMMSCVAFNSVVLIAWIEFLSKGQFKANMEMILLLLSISGFSSGLNVYANRKPLPNIDLSNNTVVNKID